MPSKKKKYNARFPAGRIKKIMQTDEEVGKVAQAVPVIISRTLELFVESLLTKSAQITQARNAKTLTPSHMKQCILSESRFDFLKDLVKNIPDASVQEDNEVPLLVDTSECSTVTSTETSAEHLEPAVIPSTSLADAFSPKFYVEQGTSKSSTVIQYGSPLSVNKISDAPKMDFSIKSLVQTDPTNAEPQIHIDLTNIVPVRPPSCSTDVPPLIPLPRTHLYTHQSTNDTLCIDEDYDN